MIYQSTTLRGNGGTVASGTCVGPFGKMPEVGKALGSMVQLAAS